MLSGGQNLSRGERQLLLLAAAALAKPKLVILDEATGAVDAKTDAAVQEFLKDKMEGSTVIVVAHRVDTVAGFDEVLVMDEGQVVEGGSPEELIGRRGYFAAWRRGVGMVTAGFPLRLMGFVRMGSRDVLGYVSRSYLLEPN